MDKLDLLTTYIGKIVADHRIASVHIALSTALCHLWIINQFANPYRISRKVLMKASRIRSKATYHKVMSELSSLGYIKYQPSYHPKEGSSVTINL